MLLPGYTEIRELGHGAFGTVMLATRDADGAQVAIKHLGRDAGFLERFREEASVIAALDSPHVVRLLEYAEGPGGAAIVMELVEGVTLRRLLQQEGPTGPEAALAVLKGSLLGLAEAHRAGVVHRDFKPENILVTGEGCSKLADFGVAVRTGDDGHLEGTPAYMAPERWEELPVGPASDIYAAAVVFFECLAGRRPFTGANVAALAYQHQHAEPPLELVDESMRILLARGLAKEPAARPASAEEFLEELEELAVAAYGTGWEVRGRAGLSALAVPYAALVRTGEPVARTGTTLARSLITGGMVAATAAAVATAFTVWRDAPAPVERAQPPVPAVTVVTPAPAVTATVTPVETPAVTPAVTITPGPVAEAPPSVRPVTLVQAGEPSPAGTTTARPPAPEHTPTRAPAKPTGEPAKEPEPSPAQPSSQQPPPPDSPPATEAPSKEPLVDITLDVDLLDDDELVGVDIGVDVNLGGIL
ncbi:serine/threonine-protein kinase [Nonomuraea soli]|uniref:non-specific serine/threonine protein kinase n=1 Tax=Nonomuraea soli TaxID=1032476 RepID=A0A7W0CRS5_9ACTN|nr:serine/threonine-protein kinase [Nonomuraea soli]MBA2896151.1 serine/threonine-protein kinase [Nonomuraea soli]